MAEESSIPVAPFPRKTLKGEDVQFFELSFAERARLLQQYRKQRIDDLMKTLGEAPPDDPNQGYMELRTEKELSDAVMWGKFFNSDNGKRAILKASIEKWDKAKGNLADDIGGYDLMDLCAAITYTPLFDQWGRARKPFEPEQPPPPPTPPPQQAQTPNGQGQGRPERSGFGVLAR